MYNEKQKQEYIDKEELNTVALTNYFKRLSKIEESYGKDIADMNAEELTAALSSLNIRSVISRGHFLTLMRKYIHWAVLSGKTHNEMNHINDIKPENIGTKYAIQTKMLRDPEQVRHILNTVYNPDFCVLPNRACRDKLIFWLLYCGLTTSEIQLLKKTDIDTTNKLVSRHEKRNEFVEVNNEVIELWKRHAKHTYIEKRGSYNENDIYFCELVDNDFLFRPLASKKVCSIKQITESLIFATVNNIYKEYDKMTSAKISVSPSSMRISGIFYKLYLEERSGKEITPEVINRYFNVEYSSAYDLSVKMRKYCIDFMDWKLAFGFQI